MNQHKRILKALSLVQPVLGAVSARRPSGMSMIEADRLAQLLMKAVDCLIKSVDYYDRAAAKKERKEGAA